MGLECVLNNSDITESIPNIQEYLVHDIDSLIGNVGGTLGMFIGFSIRKTLSYFIDVLKNYL